MTETQKKASSKIREWRADPVRFVREVFQAEPDAWQADVLKMAGEPGRKRIALKACAGPGKSTVLAWLGWHRLACFAKPGEHPKGAAVAITEVNLRDNLWAELAKWQQRSPFLLHTFTWTKTRISANDHPETWFLSFRTFQKSADADAIGRTLSGLHSEFPFYLLDESGDMPVQLAKSAEQGLSTCADGLIITAGNPSSTSGLLYDVCANRTDWTAYEITGDPEDPKRSPRVDLDWAKKQIQEHGRENAWVMTFILGKFPPGGINQLLSLEEVNEAINRHLRPPDYEWSQMRLGIDVARFGDDRSVIFPRQGLKAFEPVIMRHQRTTDIAARAAQMKIELKSEMEFVDDTGHWGHGVIDNLIAAGYSPVGLQYHGPAIDPRYYNRRAEMWMKMAEWVKRGGALPNLPELRGELTTPTYFFHQGKFQLEDKDQVKKRLGRSPDLADALAETFALPDCPSGMREQLRRGQSKPREYDPYANI